MFKISNLHRLFPDLASATLRHVKRVILMSEFILFLLAALPRLLAQSQRHRARNSGSPPASRRAQTQATAARVELSGPVLLDHPPPLLVPLEGLLVIVMPDTVTGWHPRRVRPLLALAIPAHRGPATNQRRDPRTGSAPGGRESRLGSAQDPASCKSLASSSRSGA